MTEEDVQGKIADLESQIRDIMNKTRPSNSDLIQMIALTSQKDALIYQHMTIPKVVINFLDRKLTEMMAEGGALQSAIKHEVEVVSDALDKRIEANEREIKTMKEESTAGERMPKKWEKVLRSERIRAIEASTMGVVVYDQKILDKENGSKNDDALKDLVWVIAGEDCVTSWKRMAGPASLSKWKKPTPPIISIRVRSQQERERLIRVAKAEKRFNVKREIPDLLMDEFRELSKSAW